MDTQRIATIFKEVRRAYNLSQVTLATRLKISQPHLSKIEAGKAIPGVKQWLIFCREFKLDADLPLFKENHFLNVIKSLRLKGL